MSNQYRDLSHSDYDFSQHDARLQQIISTANDLLVELHEKIEKNPDNKNAVYRHKIIHDQLLNIQRHIDKKDPFGLEIELPLLKSELTLAGVPEVERLFDGVIPHLPTAQELKDKGLIP